MVPDSRCVPPVPLRWFSSGMGRTIMELKSLLRHCTKIRLLNHGASIHSSLIKMGFSSDLIVSNHLINLYAKCGQISDARKMFETIPVKNLVSWSAMISGYNRSGKLTEAIRLYSFMDVQPNEHIYASVVSACARLSDVLIGRQVHAQAVKTGYFLISFVSNSLVSMYTKSGLFDDAYSIFSNMSEVNSVTYNTMIAGLVENAWFEKSLELFQLMTKQGFQPDMFSISAVFGVCIVKGNSWMGLGLHCQSLKLGLDVTAFIGNVILSFYSKCGMLVEVEKAFQMIEEKDLISFNTFIAACSHCNDHVKALKTFREMDCNFGLANDAFTLTSALSACSGLASVRYGNQIHARLIRTKAEFDVGVGNALMYMYAKCGSIRYALSVFRSMPVRNLVSWNTLIIGLSNHGHGMEALEAFEQMISTGEVPDSVTFVAILTACCHSGLLAEGLAYFDKMETMYKIMPQIEHLSCVIDFLGRAGRLEEAEYYLNNSSYQSDAIVWGSLLSSSWLHGNVIVGDRAARKLLDLQPMTSSPYVLMANLHASSGRWHGVCEARKMLKDGGIRKEPGYSLIEVNGVIEKFTVGYFSHATSAEIMKVLVGLNRTIKELHH